MVQVSTIPPAKTKVTGEHLAISAALREEREKTVVQRGAESRRADSEAIRKKKQEEKRAAIRRQPVMPTNPPLAAPASAPTKPQTSLQAALSLQTTTTNSTEELNFEDGQDLKTESWKYREPRNEFDDYDDYSMGE